MVGELVEQHAPTLVATGSPLREPSSREQGIAEHRVDRLYAADGSRRHVAMGGRQVAVPPQVEAHEDVGRRARRHVDDAIGVLEVEGQRLLDEDVLAGPKRRQHHVGVSDDRHAHRDRLDLRGLHELLDVRVLRGRRVARAVA